MTINGLVVDRYPAQGLPLVMIHGASAGAWCWDQWGPYFAGAGYDVYALNLRGHPPNPEDPDLGRLSLADYAADVEAVMETLERPPVLMGHSMGGAIAQLVAARRDLAALTMICPAPLGGVKYQTAGFNIWVALHGVKSIPALLRKKPLKPGRRVLRDAVLNRVATDRRDALLQRFVPESAAAGVEILRGSVVADLSRVAVPKLAVGGTDDHTSPLVMVREIAAAQGAECLELEGHAHLPMLEPGAEQVAERIAGWLREQGVA